MSDIIRRCKDCGKALAEGGGNRRKYCDACRKLRKKRPTAPVKKRLYAKPGTDTSTQPCIAKPKEKPKTNHDLLVDDNAAAAAKGMSYGHFKEWQRRQKELKERGEI